MNEETRQQPYQHENHKKPITRREFLSQGFLAGSAMVMAPNLINLVAAGNAKAAADCGAATVGGNSKIPFICVDLAGGANIAGSNVLVGGPGGQMDFLSTAGYEKLGLPSDMIPSLPGQVNTELGLAFHADSAFLRGIQSKTSIATRANINGSVIAARSSNDTRNNPHNPMYGISKAGADGDLVTLIGSRNSISGGRSRAPDSMIDLSAQPTKVDSAADTIGLVDTGKLLSLLSPNDAQRVMQSIERISSMKLSKIEEKQFIKDVVECSYRQSTGLVSRFGNPDVVNPLLDPTVTSIFSATELSDVDLEKTAAIMKLVAEGFVGAGTIELGGFDYHNNSRATGERKDFKAGQVIGASLEFAATRAQPLMIYVFSDGSLASSGQIDNSTDGRGKGIWRADSSSTSSVFFLVYNPNGRPQTVSDTSGQIGFFRSDASVETAATPASNNVNLLAETIVLNYMALHDEIGRFSEVLPNHSLGNAAALDALVSLQPLT